MYSNKARTIDIPENLFSNIGEIKSRELSKKYLEKNEEPIIESPKKNEEPKLVNYNNRQEYRSRINRMYEDLKDIRPIDNEIDNVLYFNNYVEKGIVIKPKVSSLKQFWTEYRLINNEKSITNEVKSIESDTLDEFDVLFEALTDRVTEINKYIDELKEMRDNIEESNNKLAQDQEKLSVEKQRFQDYKEQEEKKLKEEKENLKLNFNKLQTLIKDLDKKLVTIDE